MLLSIIVPCYNEEDTIPLFYAETKKVTENITGLDIEYIFIDDGSRDNTLYTIKKLSAENINVKYIAFSRNFGKEAGILAGLRAAGGDYVAVMDVDMQDPPEMLPEMLALLLSCGEYDCIAARRVSREGEPVFRSLFSKAFYALIRKISDVDIADGARDFRMFTRQVRDAVLELNEYNRFSKGIFGWVGFRTKWLEYSNKNRASGNTKWSMKKLFLYALDGIMAFSTFPLRLITYLGIFMAFFSCAVLIFIVVRTMLYGDPVAGWPSLICFTVFLSGGQFIALGVIGGYIAKMYMEVKNRPGYIIKDSNIYTLKRLEEL